MSTYLAIMAMIGQLVTIVALSYPVDYVVERTLVRPARWLSRKRYEWDAGHRD